MRSSSSAAWTAALAVMSMHGPLTMAEAAPAHHYDQERPQYYQPKHFRRGGYNSSAPAIESTSSEVVESDTSTSTGDGATIPPLPFAENTRTHTRRTRTSTKSHPSDDEMLSSFLAEGLLPMTANTVVTTTLTVERNKFLLPETNTYTITYTETSSPATSTTSTSTTKIPKSPEYSAPPVPLVTSVSLPSSPSVVAVPEPQDTSKAHHKAKPHKDTTTPSSSIALGASSYAAGNSSIGFFPTAHPSSSSVFYSEPYSSSVAPSSDGLFGIPGLGGTGNLGRPTANTKTEHAKQPLRTHDSKTSETDAATHLLPTGTGSLPIPNVVPHFGETHTRKHKSKTSTTTKNGLLGTGFPLFGTNGILPTDGPLPTAPLDKTATHARSKESTSSDGHLIVGLSTAISLPPAPSEPLLNPHHRPQNKETTTKTGLLDGLTGLPTGLPTGLAPSDLPSMPSVSLPAGSSQLPADTPQIVNPFARPTGGRQHNPDHNPRPSGIPQVGPSALVSDLTKGLPTVTGGVFPPSGSAAPTGNDGTLPLVPGVTSLLTGLNGPNGVSPSGPADASQGADTSHTGTATGTGLLDTLTDALPTLTNVLPTVTPDSSMTLPDAGSVLSNPSNLPPVIPEIGPSGTGLALTTPTSLTVTNGDQTFTVPMPSNTAVTSGENPLGVPAVTVPSDTYTGLAGTTTTSPDSAATTGPTPSSPYNEGTTTLESTTAGDSASSIPGYESPSAATSTSIGLNGPTTVPVGSTGAVPSSYVEPTPPASSEVASETSTGSSAAPGYPEQSSGSLESSTTVGPASPTTMGPTIHPTGTDTYTSLTLPETWTFAPTTTRTNDLATAGPSAVTSVPSGIPTYMPQYVQPPGGMPRAPTNATLIQIGFKYGLNYPFVVSQPESASQIFAYLPQGIAYGLGISRKHVVMNGLMPFDTSADLKYITTLATAYVPSEYVSKLELDLHRPFSDCYGNPSSPVKTLMNMINPTIPILSGPSQYGASSSGWDNSAATDAAGGGAAPIGGDSGNSNKVRGTSVGIGVGAVCGAAVYAAAMVYVARRYRRNRANHKRASSVPSQGEMSQRSGGMGSYFMSGANGRRSGSGSGGRGSRTSAGSSNGRSVREQGISAPIMAENSLGWT